VSNRESFTDGRRSLLYGLEQDVAVLWVEQSLTLLKRYISERLRRDDAQFDQYTARRLADALKRRGVTEKVLQEAMKEIAENS